MKVMFLFLGKLTLVLVAIVLVTGTFFGLAFADASILTGTSDPTAWTQRGREEVIVFTIMASAIAWGGIIWIKLWDRDG